MQKHAQLFIGEYQTKLDLHHNNITILLKKKNDNHMLKTVISNDNLPSSFINIFDNVTQLFDYAEKNFVNHAIITNNQLKIKVKSFKIRQIVIDFDVVSIPKEEILSQNIQKLEQTTKKMEDSVKAILPSLQTKVNNQSKRITKIFLDEIKKLSARVSELQAKNKNQQNTFSKPPIFKFHQPSNLFFQSQPRINLFNEVSQSKQSKIGANIFEIDGLQINQNLNKDGKIYDFQFDIDFKSKYLEYFKISKNTITRKKQNQQIYMISSDKPFSIGKKYSIKMKINQIDQGLIWVGLLSKSKKYQQYIGQQTEIIQYSLDGVKAIINGQIKQLIGQQFKNGDILQMQINIFQKSFKIYKNLTTIPIFETNIPQNMLKQPIYPYVQFINAGDSITFIKD